MTLKLSKKSRIILLTIFSFGIISNLIFAYDETIVHPSLTQEMAKLYNLNYGNKLTEQEINWLKQGSIDEDKVWGGIKQIRSSNHFYNPSGITEWKDYNLDEKISAYFSSGIGNGSKKWAHDSVAQSEYIGGDYTWERAIYDYANGDKKHAYESLGHILHLIEDSTVPAHTRNDFHLSPKELEAYQSWLVIKNFVDYEPFETWTGNEAKSGNLKFNFADNLWQENKKPIILSNLDEYFDNVAGYANTNFFSKDTIYAYSEPNNNAVEGKEKASNGKNEDYVYGMDENNQKFRLAKIFTEEDKNGQFVKSYTISNTTPEIHSDYWSRLAPKSILAGAGIIKLFKDEAEKAKSNPSSIQKPLTAVTYYVTDPVNKKADEIKSYAIAFYDWQKAIAVAAYNIGNSMQSKAADFFNSTAKSVSQYFSPSAKAQLVFDISSPIKGTTVAEILEASKTIEADFAPEITKAGLAYNAKPASNSNNALASVPGKNIAVGHIEAATPKVATSEIPIAGQENIAPENGNTEIIPLASPEPSPAPAPNDNPPSEEASSDTTIGDTLTIAETERLQEEEDRAIRRKRARAWAATPPETAIVGFPENPTAETAADFKFSSDKNPSSFYCSLDGAEFALCEETATFEKLAAGDHNLKVKAKDEFGNIDETPAEYSWTVEAAENIHLAISEIRAGTNENGAEDEFVELYNPTKEIIDLAGWKLQKKNSSGNEENLVDDKAFYGKIAPHGFFLIAHKNYKGGAAADLIYSANSNNLSYKNNSAILYNSNGLIVDEFLWIELAKDKSLERKALADNICVSAQGKGEFLGNGCDTDDPGDFEIRLNSNPQNSASIAEPVPTPAHNITNGLDYPTIQWAIDNAKAGDEIQADSGTYYENVNVNKRLILKGIDIGSGKPIVDAKGNGSAITIRADGSAVEGFSAINSDISRNWHSGIEIRSDNNIVKNNNVSNNYYGIYLGYADNNVVSGNIADSNAYDGIVLANSSYNTIDNNVASNNSYGIQLSDDSYYNAVNGNIANFNRNDGFFIGYGYENTLNNNSAKSNAYGIFIFSGGRNKIYHNNFTDSTQYNVDDRSGISNIWDDGYPSGGNYWSDYSGTDLNSGADQNQAGSDGIGDAAYGILCNNFNTCGGVSWDRYPLMSPYPPADEGGEPPQL